MRAKSLPRSGVSLLTELAFRGEGDEVQYVEIVAGTGGGSLVLWNHVDVKISSSFGLLLGFVCKMQLIRVLDCSEIRMSGKVYWL